MKTTWLQCAECKEQFEVSTAVAEGMRDWRKDSGEPFLCVECATEIAWGDAIAAISGIDEEPADTVGGNSDSRQLTTESCKQ